GWKDWQLHLWHAFSYQPLATDATIFRLILISSTTRKSPASSGGLNVLCLTAVTRRNALLPPPLPARKTVLFLHEAVDTVGRDREQPVLQPFDTSLLAQIPQVKLEIVRRLAENPFQLNDTHTTALQTLSSFRV